MTVVIEGHTINQHDPVQVKIPHQGKFLWYDGWRFEGSHDKYTVCLYWHDDRSVMQWWHRVLVRPVPPIMITYGPPLSEEQLEQLRKDWEHLNLKPMEFISLPDKAEASPVAQDARCGTICHQCGLCIACYQKAGKHACPGDSGPTTINRCMPGAGG